MAEEPQLLRGINWRETFAFTNIFRSFRIAVHPSKLVLALVALLLLYVGGRVLDGVWPEGHRPVPNEIRGYEQWLIHGAGEFVPQRDEAPRASAGIFITFFEYEVRQVNQVAWGVVSFNWLGGDGVVPSVVNFVIVGPSWMARYHSVYFILFLVWFLLIWSVFGGAISRIAAVHVARDEKLSVRSAMRFSIQKVLSFLFAPIIPLLILLVVGLLVAVGGLLLYIPYAGPVVVGALYALALAAGFVMTLVLIGTVGGFNLMYPTVAVEGSDSFDAISRAFSYVYAKPWRMLFYTVVAVIYGALTYLFIRLFLFLVLALAHFFTDLFLTRSDERWENLWPGPQFWDLPYPIDYAALNAGQAAGAFLVAFWVYLVIGVLGAFAISFYFSANTIIYYLLRREVDATELDDVYLEQTDEEFGETAPVTAPAETATPAPPAEPRGVETSPSAGPAEPPSPEAPVEPAPPEPPAELRSDSERPAPDEDRPIG